MPLEVDLKSFPLPSFLHKNEDSSILENVAIEVCLMSFLTFLVITVRNFRVLEY